MKIKYILTWFHTPHDTSGNSYSYFHLIDTVTGIKLEGRDVTESSVRLILYLLNGQEHISNYYYTRNKISKTDYRRMTEDVKYIGCNSEVLAHLFQSMLGN